MQMKAKHFPRVRLAKLLNVSAQHFLLYRVPTWFVLLMCSEAFLFFFALSQRVYQSMILHFSEL